MSDYLFLVPLSLVLGLIGLAAFLWTLRHEQYDDLDGAAERVLFADDWPITGRSPDGDRHDADGEQDNGADAETASVARADVDPDRTHES